MLLILSPNLHRYNVFPFSSSPFVLTIINNPTARSLICRSIFILFLPALLAMLNPVISSKLSSFFFYFSCLHCLSSSAISHSSARRHTSSERDPTFKRITLFFSLSSFQRTGVDGSITCPSHLPPASHPALRSAPCNTDRKTF